MTEEVTANRAEQPKTAVSVATTAPTKSVTTSSTAPCTTTTTSASTKQNPISSSTPDDVIISSSKRDQQNSKKEEMYHHIMMSNGNLPYYGGYYANRYLPFSNLTSGQTAGTSSEDNLPPPPPPPTTSNGSALNRHTHQNTRHSISDTVAVIGDDLSNVPAAVIIQLEKANRTIASQTLEIERLKSYQNQHQETHLLKKQIQDLEKEVRSSRSRFLEQQELLAEISREMDNVLREKLEMQRSFQDLERKYKKAKFASRELAKILENDLCASPTGENTTKFANNFDLYESDEEFLEKSSKHPLFDRSRQLSRQQNQEKLMEKLEIATKNQNCREKSLENRKNQEIIEKLIDENENLSISLDRERKINESLQDDLEKNRRLVIDRDEQIEILKMKLGKAETKATQCESDLTRTSTDLAMERLRSEALTAELHEIEGIFRNTQSTIQAYAAENEQLEDSCREARRTIVALNSKLEAQGIDLVTTKKTLRALRESQAGTF